MEGCPGWWWWVLWGMGLVILATFVVAVSLGVLLWQLEARLLGMTRSSSPEDAREGGDG